jgi:tetratricopeptide (TPR) repeat protein
MLKANFKSVFFITLVSTFTFLLGCSTPEEKKAAQIEEALNLSQAGSNAEALKILENLTQEYPNDIEILKSIGQIYKAEGDASMAAFFLEQAYLQSPDDTELLYQTYQSLEAANQPSGKLLEKFAEKAPESMTPELWVRLGQARQAENQVQLALDAYLKGVNPDKSKPSADTAAAIGQLFVKVGNLPQAENWLKIAADSEDPNALTALFGLLEINLHQKNWAGAESTIAQLDEQFPGAVEASQWKQARQELIRWRQAQDEMQAKLAKAEAEKKAKAKAEAEAKAAAQAAAEAQAKAKAAAQAAQSSTSNTTAPSNRPELSQSEERKTTETIGGKAQIIADLEIAEAMADTPAIEVPPGQAAEASVSSTPPPADSTNKTITFNPNIAIEPADPEITFEISYDQAPHAEPSTYTIETETSTAPTATRASTTTPTPAPVAAPTAPQSNYNSPAAAAPISPSPARPQTVEELMADAETALFDRNYKAAIRKYWAAISIINNRADIWNQLGRAYLVDGQLQNAETTALEAVRLEPRQVAYTLDYLRVAQRSKPPQEFLAELETAYARFPSSPEIILSLARGHERISKDLVIAQNLYRRFIDIAPNHPLVPEARAAVARLGEYQ